MVKKQILDYKGNWDKKSTKSRFYLLNTVSQCTAQSLSKSIPHPRAASFLAFLLLFVSVWNSILQLHNFKSFGVHSWKYSHPISAAQLLGYIYGGKKTPRLNTIPLLRIRQPYYLNKVSSFPSTHIILCQESQFLLCVLDKFFPLYHSPSLFPYSSALPNTGFALIFPASVHVHCFTPPHLFNV